MAQPTEVGCSRRRAQLDLYADDRSVVGLGNDVHLSAVGRSEVVKLNPRLEAARLLEDFACHEVLEQQAGRLS